MGEDFEPKVVAFCRHYCAYSAADLAGSMRLEYAPNVRVVKIMCTGKVDTLHLLKAFEDGGYEAGSRPSMAVVPEPSSLLLFAMALATTLRRRARAQ